MPMRCRMSYMGKFLCCGYSEDSDGNFLVVDLEQIGQAIPERFGPSLAGYECDQASEARVPAGRETECGRTIGQAAVHQSQQHLIALQLQIDRDVAIVAEHEDDAARRVELENFGLHAVL